MTRPFLSLAPGTEFFLIAGHGFVVNIVDATRAPFTATICRVRGLGRLWRRVIMVRHAGNVTLGEQLSKQCLGSYNGD